MFSALGIFPLESYGSQAVYCSRNSLSLFFITFILPNPSPNQLTYCAIKSTKSLIHGKMWYFSENRQDGARYLITSYAQIISCFG